MSENDRTTWIFVGLLALMLLLFVAATYGVTMHEWA